MKYVVINYKGNLTSKDALNYSSSIDEMDLSKIHMIICPQAPLFGYYSYRNYSLGSQDITQFSGKNLTGEITGQALKSVGCKYVLIGHSDIRKNYGDSENEIVNKINNVFDNGMIPIYIVGETKEERDRKKTYSVIERQLTRVLSRIEKKEMIIAYEPFWSIGNGIIPEISDINDAVQYIKELLVIKFNVNLPVLYGGSVDDVNIRDLSDIDIVDGYIIGATSLNITKLTRVINQIK